MPNTKTHQTMITTLFMLSIKQKMLVQLSKFMLLSPGTLLYSFCDSCVEWNNDVVELDFPKRAVWKGSLGGKGTANRGRMFRRKAQEHPPLHSMLDLQ